MSDLDDLEPIADSMRRVPRHRRMTISDKVKAVTKNKLQRGRSNSLRSRVLNSSSKRKHKVPITLPKVSI